MELWSNAFPPRWNTLSGMDYRLVGRCTTAISVKLYTMHWPMMLRFYGNQLRQANPGVCGSLLALALVRLFDISDDPAPDRFEDLCYPSPDEPHPAGAEAQHRKIVQAQHDAGETPVYALAHGYGPAGDFRNRLATAMAASRHGCWINRYGYLSDEKLEIIGKVARRS